MSKKASNPSKHILYEASVQGTEIDLELINRIYQAEHGQKPLTLREDFCGTALLACDWVEQSTQHRAYGLDLHAPTLNWAKKHRLRSLAAEDRERVTLCNLNVMDPQAPGADVVAALNFSYMIFRERALLLQYFKQVAASLTPGGLFLLDLFGGPHAQEVMSEEKEIEAGSDSEGTPYPAFTYVWEQKSFNAVNQHIDCRIHFKGLQIKERKNAFRYSWRLWSITELCDLLNEAGFERVDPYFEGWDDEAESTDGNLQIRKNYEGMSAWLCYLAAQVPSK